MLWLKFCFKIPCQQLICCLLFCNILHANYLLHVLRCENVELKNKQLTETNLDLIDKVKDVEETRDEEIAKWKTNYEKLEKLKEESDSSKSIVFQ